MEEKCTNHYGWYNTINNFLNYSNNSLITDLSNHHLKCMNMPADPSQIIAWRNCINVLKSQLPNLINKHPVSSNWSIIFEYELPRERGRRPDVIILSESAIYVIEFKDYREPLVAHIDQVSAYARDLQNYHAESHYRTVIPILLPTLSKNINLLKDDVCILSPGNLPDFIIQITNHGYDQRIDPDKWVKSDYAPLPSLVNAARLIFKNESLPRIRRAESAGIPETMTELVKIGKQAQGKNELHLALVTGVPGAGKTLVGLQLVYTNYFEDKGNGRTSVFLSGNGPLVKVLQHALKSNVFVQGVHGFLKQYGGSNNSCPQEHIWVYDEAQRAWDGERVREKRGHGASEPEDLLRLGERMNSWAFMVGLIGEGQEIHLGEEAGLIQWNDAIGKMDKPWIVHCPEKVAHLFTNAKAVCTNNKLDLTSSLRSHIAEDVQDWVKLVLDGRIDEAAQLSTKISEQGFDMYITQDLEIAKNYVRERYKGQNEKRFGLLASSKAKNLPQYSIHNEYQFTKNMREGPWYNDSPESKGSCCQLHDVATEFSCQGLELDFPIIGWGVDLIWTNNKWESIRQSRSKAKNPHQLRVNSYRVLLTRGRDGLIIFVPDEKAMQGTFNALMNAGLSLLKDEIATSIVTPITTIIH